MHLSVGTVFMPLPWEHGDQAKKRETMTSKRAEVLVCVKKSKGKLVNALDSCPTKGE